MSQRPRYQNGKLTRGYRKWSSMLSRCYNPSHPAYPYYGDRGITVCERWRGRGAFDRFIADMGGEPPDGLTLDRIDNERGYEPGNCRWATWKEQAANRRPQRPHNPDSLRQKAIRAGLPYHVVYQRIQAGWKEDYALSQPKRPMSPRKRRNISTPPRIP